MESVFLCDRLPYIYIFFLSPICQLVIAAFSFLNSFLVFDVKRLITGHYITFFFFFGMMAHFQRLVALSLLSAATKQMRFLLNHLSAGNTH